MVTRAEDLLAVISRRTSDPLHRFLRKAFNPSARADANPSRMDVLLDRARIFRTAGEARVLDLGSGDCLLLENLLADHGRGTVHLGRIAYVAVDSRLRGADLRWTELKGKATGVCCCFCLPALVTMDFASPGQLRSQFAGQRRRGRDP